MVFSESPEFSVAPLPATADPPPAAKMTTTTCSLCGSDCRDCRACSESAGAGGFMLFGVRLTEKRENSAAAGGSLRKSASMTDLAHHGCRRQDSNALEYASDDAGKCRERRRGVPWTEDEHRMFLLGLKTVGKGDWRGISRNFVKTRTPTQVASHAQKYFIRRSGANRRRRRSSLFDITSDTLMTPSSSEEHLRSKPPLNQRARATPSSQMKLPSSRMADLNLNEFPPTLSAAPESEVESPATRRPAAAAARFCGNRESAISVA